MKNPFKAIGNGWTRLRTGERNFSKWTGRIALGGLVCYLIQPLLESDTEILEFDPNIITLSDALKVQFPSENFSRNDLEAICNENKIAFEIRDGILYPDIQATNPPQQISIAVPRSLLENNNDK